MIQFLSDNIDQLDLALDQLAISDRNFDRFALMLIDNVVELTLHKFAQDKDTENNSWRSLDMPTNDPKVVAKAMGQNFDAKVKAAAKFGLIDESTCETLLNLHSFRNTAYHKGLRHERILHSLAIFYFRNACALLTAYKPGWFGWHSGDKISYRAMKYIGSEVSFSAAENYKAAYVRLDSIAEKFDESLVDDLAADMSATIESTDDDLEFLSTNSPTPISRDQVIVDTQAWPFGFSEEGKSFAANNGCPANTVGAIVDWIAENYNWQIKKDPIVGWRERLDALAGEKDYHKALKRYCDFMRQTDKIRSQLSDSSAALDSHIQHAVDLARGK